MARVISPRFVCSASAISPMKPGTVETPSLRQRVTELQAETLRSFDRALERNPQFRQSMGSKTQEI